MTARRAELGEPFSSGTVILGEGDRGATLVQMETLMGPRSHPCTQMCLQLWPYRPCSVPALVYIPAGISTWHVGILHLKPSSFSKKEDVVHVIR